MRDERPDVFLPEIPRWKTHAKNGLMWLYAHGLLPLGITGRIYDLLDLKNA